MMVYSTVCMLPNAVGNESDGREVAHKYHINRVRISLLRYRASDVAMHTVGVFLWCNF